MFLHLIDLKGVGETNASQVPLYRQLHVERTGWAIVKQHAYMCPFVQPLRSNLSEGNMQVTLTAWIRQQTYSN